MAEIKFLRGSGVPSTSVVDGQLLFDVSGGIIYLDNGTERVELYSTAIKAGDYKNDKLTLYRNADKSDASPIQIDLPAEQFLDAASTTFEESFDHEDYEGSDAALDGKPVLVMGLKTKNVDANGTVAETVTYHYLNMEKLVDSDRAHMIDGVTATNEDEIVTVKYDSIASKGDIKTSGKKIVTTLGVSATEAAAESTTATALDTNVPTQLAVAEGLYGKMDKVASGKGDEILTADAKGNAQASGKKVGGATLAATPDADTVATEKAVSDELDKKVNAPTAAVTDSTIAQFDGTDGKTIKSTGLSVVTSIRANAAGGADDLSLPSEKSVRTELDTKITRVAEDNSKEDELLLANDVGYAKASGKKFTTTIRPATLTQDDIDNGKTLANDTAQHDAIPTEKAVRDAIKEGTQTALTWGTF